MSTYTVLSSLERKQPTHVCVKNLNFKSYLSFKREVALQCCVRGLQFKATAHITVTVSRRNEIAVQEQLPFQ